MRIPWRSWVGAWLVGAGLTVAAAAPNLPGRESEGGSVRRPVAFRDFPRTRAPRHARGTSPEEEFFPAALPATARLITIDASRSAPASCRRGPDSSCRLIQKDRSLDDSLHRARPCRASPP